MKRDKDELELLTQKLRWLRLPGMAHAAPELLAEASKKNLSALEVIQRLCDEEKKSRSTVPSSGAFGMRASQR